MTRIGSLHVEVERRRLGPEIVFAEGYGATGHVLSRSSVDDAKLFAEELLGLCDGIERVFQLSPCPFCGGEAVIDWSSNCVECTRCGACRSSRDGVEAAVGKWNTRVIP